jgi:hypothetical protein
MAAHTKRAFLNITGDDDPAVKMECEIRYTFDASVDDMARLSYLMAALIPLVREFAPFIVGGAFVCVAYPDATTMEANLASVGTDDDPTGKTWKPYALVHAQHIVDPAIVSVPNKNAVVFSAGHYDTRGMFWGACMSLPTMLWTNAAVRSHPANPARTLSMMAFKDELDDTQEIMRRLQSMCALCGKESGELAVCKGCDTVRYCSESCRIADESFHLPTCSTIRALHARMLPAVEKITAVETDVQQFHMSFDGIFDDAVRNRLYWDVTQPPSSACLLPSCISMLRAWRRKSMAPPVSQRHLEAVVTGISAHSHVRLAIPDFDIVVNVYRSCDKGITVGDLLTAIHKVVTSVPTAGYLAYQRGRHPERVVKNAPLLRVCETDTEHRRFDMLQPSMYRANSFRVRLGGMHVMHRSRPGTGHMLYDATFA